MSFHINFVPALGILICENVLVILSCSHNNVTLKNNFCMHETVTVTIHSMSPCLEMAW